MFSNQEFLSLERWVLSLSFSALVRFHRQALGVFSSLFPAGIVCFFSAQLSSLVSLASALLWSRFHFIP